MDFYHGTLLDYFNKHFCILLPNDAAEKLKVSARQTKLSLARVLGAQRMFLQPIDYCIIDEGLNSSYATAMLVVFNPQREIRYPILYACGPTS
jgi:hypothetical protein